jgi:hypothetical protein
MKSSAFVSANVALADVLAILSDDSRQAFVV